MCVCVHVCELGWVEAVLWGLINTDCFFTSDIYVAVNVSKYHCGFKCTITFPSRPVFLLPHLHTHLAFFYDTDADNVVVVALETFLRLLQPNSFAACCWLCSVVSAVPKHLPHITLLFAVLST